MRAHLLDDPRLRNRIHVFRDRGDAGRRLVEMLRGLFAGGVVLAIPMGGVPVGSMVAEGLNATFDVAVVRKIQIPGNPEAGYGAVSWEGEVVLNHFLVEHLSLSEQEIRRGIETVRRDLEDRSRILRGNKPFPVLEGKEVLLVDDGLASGYTMMAAAKTVAKHGPSSITVAVPTASSSAVKLVGELADRVVCLNLRSGFPFAVADAYLEWRDLSMDEVGKILKEARGF